MSDKKKLTRILSIDGGGIRGIIPGQILIYLENKLRELENNPDARLADYFDMMAGTSTGGILSCAYLCPDPDTPDRSKFSAQEAVDLYMTKGNDIFSRSPWQKLKSAGGLVDEKYSEGALEKYFLEYFAETKLSELLKPCLVTAYDTERRNAFFFTQQNALDSGRDFMVRDILRATSAAPTYFEVAGIKSLSGVFYSFVDGGVFANNPTMCAYAEARKTDFGHGKTKPTAAEMLILSIGTGVVDKQYQYKDVKSWGTLHWIKPVIDIMMSGVAETVDYQLKQIYDSVGKQENYLRIAPELNDASPEMDEVSPENLDALKKAGELATEANRDELDRVAGVLIANKS